MGATKRTSVSTPSASKHGASAEEVIEKEIATIFDTEIRKAAREFRSMGRLLESGCDRENS